MKLKELLDKDADRAWESLYQRLDKDGLLGSAIESVQPQLRRYTTLKWAASIAVLVVGIASLFLLTGKQETTPAEKLVLSTGTGEPTLVTTLEDGSTVYLNEQTSIEYPMHFAGNKREIAMKGDAFFEIARNEESPFIIETESALIEVLGTSFNVVTTGDDSFSLSVRQGEVRVTSRKDGEKVHVRAGETALLQSNKLQKFATDNPDRFKSYTRHLYFKDQTLMNVVRIMNEKNKGSIPLQCSSELADKKLTVTFANQPPDEVAEIICLGLNLQYTRQPDMIYIKHPD